MAGGHSAPGLQPLKEGERLMPHGWWIIPLAIAGLCLWLAVLKLTGVL